MASAPVRSPRSAAAAAASNWSVTLAMALTTTTGVKSARAPAFDNFSGAGNRGRALHRGAAELHDDDFHRAAHGFNPDGDSLPCDASNSAFSSAAPAAPRIVLCDSTVNFQSSREQGRNRPTVAAMPRPRMRSSRGCGRSSAGLNSTGCSGAVGRFCPLQRLKFFPGCENFFPARLAGQLDADAFRVAIFHRDAIAVRAHFRVQQRDLGIFQLAQQPARLGFQLLFFILDEGNYVAQNVERRHARISGAADRLHGADKHRAQAEPLRQRL